MLLSSEPRMDVVATASDGREALDATDRHRPDVIVMELAMPVLDGVAATAALQDRYCERPAPRVLILTDSTAQDSLYAALRAGAAGLALKNIVPSQLAFAVGAIAAGQGWL